MVLIKKVLLYGTAVVSAMLAHGSVALETENAVAARDLPVSEKSFMPLNERDGIEARAPGRMTLQWSPQGRFLFLLGMNLPQSVLDGFYGLGEAGPAKAMLQNFRTFVDFSLIPASHNAWTQLNAATDLGGVYGKGAGVIADTFGFGIQLAANAAPGDVQDVRQLIIAWAQQAGGVVQVLPRPNNFYDLATIGAGGSKRLVRLKTRSRSNECPASTDLLKFATIDVPDVDINQNIRWGGSCDA